MINTKRLLPKRIASQAVALALVSVIGLSACSGAGQKETIGGASGAVLGGVLGSQVGKGKGQLVAVGLGAVLGALAGSSIGRSLDEVDKMKINNTATEELHTLNYGGIKLGATEDQQHNPARPGNPTGSTGFDLVQPEYREFRCGNAPKDLSEHRWPVLPRIHTDRGYRRRVATGLWHSLSSARRNLENRQLSLISFLLSERFLLAFGRRTGMVCRCARCM